MKKILISLLLLSSIATSAFTSPEMRRKIVIIDTGANPEVGNIKNALCAYGHRSFVDNRPLVDDYHTEHGTNIAGIIADGLDTTKYCLIILKYISESNGGKIENEVAAIQHATYQDPYIINLSLGGADENPLERRALQEALNKGIIISVAAGNEGLDLDKGCVTYPACYAKDFNNKNYHVVGSTTANIRRYSNHGKIVNYLEDGTHKGFNALSGTSQSTAIHTNKLARGL